MPENPNGRVSPVLQFGERFCCGIPRDSRFCPECGKQLREHKSLHGLLRHCRKSQERYESKSGLNGTDNPHNAAKWGTWADELEQLLKASELKAEANGPSTQTN